MTPLPLMMDGFAQGDDEDVLLGCQLNMAAASFGFCAPGE
jgi:hypothetical protein